MGRYHGAELCELVGLLVLHNFNGRFGKKHGSSPRRRTGFRTDEIRITKRQGLEKTWYFGLKITARANQQVTHVRDLTLNSAEDTYKPYRNQMTNRFTSTVHSTTRHQPFLNGIARLQYINTQA